MSFAVGAVVAAVATGVGVSLVGDVVVIQPWHPYLQFMIGGIAALGACVEAFGIRTRAPSAHWQIPARWTVFGPLRFAFSFGAILGAGFITVVPYVGYYIILVHCLALGNMQVGALLMGAFGIARALPVLLLRVGLAAGEAGGSRDRAVEAASLLVRFDRGPLMAALRAGALATVAGSVLGEVGKGAF